MLHNIIRTLCLLLTQFAFIVENRVRRTWLPHVVSKVLKSDLLGTELRINVTAKALRCIDKAGTTTLERIETFLLLSRSHGVNLSQDHLMTTFSLPRKLIWTPWRVSS